VNAGVVRLDITPPVGTRLSGFAGRDWRSDGVRDPLLATILWLSDGTKNTAIVSLDTIGLTVTDDRRLRRAVANAAGTPAEAVLVACSHTHAGAATMGIRATGHKETAWTRELVRRCTEGAAAAKRAARPVERISVGTAACGASVNRRTPYGPGENAVRTLVLHADRPIAALFHTAMHPVCLGNQDRHLSADWVGDARRILENALEVPALFLQGCCGDINPRVRDAAGIGEEVGDALCRSVSSASDASPVLRAGFSRGTIPLNPLASEAHRTDFEIRANTLLRDPSSSLAARQLAQADLSWVRKCRAIERSGSMGPIKAAFPCTTIGIGPVNLVGWPGEVFHAIGLDLQSQSAEPWPVGFAAGNPGYLYPDTALEEGGYEVDLAYRLYGTRQAGRGTADALIDAARRSLEIAGQSQ